MVTKGKIRGNGDQIGKYLAAKGDNDWVKILEANGLDNPDAEYMQAVLRDWQLLAELTKSGKGLYHASINPAYGEDTNMDWRKAADIMAKEMGYENQPRVIVLHHKNGKMHAHVVWQRYDTNTQKMVPNEFSRVKQNRSRKKMEFVFNHELTPTRNPHIPELKVAMTDIWRKTSTGAEFIAEAERQGYRIAAGEEQRNPFIVVDKSGKGVNLPRYIKGATIGDIKRRLGNEPLPSREQAIAEMRKAPPERKPDTEIADHLRKIRAARGFGLNIGNTPDDHERKTLLASAFAETRSDAVKKKSARQETMERMIAEQKEISERAKRKSLGKHLCIAIAFMIRLVIGNPAQSYSNEIKPSIRYIWNRPESGVLHDPKPRNLIPRWT